MSDPHTQGWSPIDADDDFSAIVGPVWSRGQGPEREFGFVAQRKHLSRYSRLHGAMVMWLADKAMAHAAWYAAQRPRQLATVQLDTHFMAIVAEGSFVRARCQVVRTTGSLVFVEARLWVQDEAVASASGLWKYR